MKTIRYQRKRRMMWFVVSGRWHPKLAVILTLPFNFKDADAISFPNGAREFVRPQPMAENDFDWTWSRDPPVTSGHGRIDAVENWANTFQLKLPIFDFSFRSRTQPHYCVLINQIDYDTFSGLLSSHRYILSWGAHVKRQRKKPKERKIYVRRNETEAISNSIFAKALVFVRLDLIHFSSFNLSAFFCMFTLHDKYQSS